MPTQGGNIRYRLSQWHSAKTKSPVQSFTIFAILTLVFIGCHRTDFDADQTSVCPEPEGNLVVVDYTLNCLYVGDQPDTGCPDAAPNIYLFEDTFICSERSGANNNYLRAVIDVFLNVDAGGLDMMLTDMSVPFSDLTSTVDGGNGADGATTSDPTTGAEPDIDPAQPVSTDNESDGNGGDDGDEDVVSCDLANNGVCNEPIDCEPGTDVADCNEQPPNDGD